MAVALVRALDSPVPESPGKWKKGMAAVVMPDDHVWGRKEGPPTFVRIRLPNLTVEEARPLLTEYEEDLGEDGDPVGLIRRRVRGFRDSDVDEARARGGEMAMQHASPNALRGILRAF